MMKSGRGLSPLLAAVAFDGQADAHGALLKPRARNVRNNVENRDWNWMSVNENQEGPSYAGPAISGCGRTQRDITPVFDYDDLLPSGWYAEESYNAGQEIELEVGITAHHEGFFEFFVCFDVGNPTKACFDQYPLELVSDPLYGAPKDVFHPTRAYIPPYSFPAYRHTSNGRGRLHRYKMRLPSNMPNGNALLQWRYTTGNTCQLEDGYSNYYNSLWAGQGSAYDIFGICQNPLPETRTDLGSVPERFWNCAEVSIFGSVGGGPSPNPTNAPPSRPPAPTSPTSTPPVALPPSPSPPAPIQPSPNPPSSFNECCSGGTHLTTAVVLCAATIASTLAFSRVLCII